MDNSKVVIGIPSLGRSLAILKYTVAIVSRTQYDWFVFVEPQEYDSYCNTCGEEHVVSIQKSFQGVGYSRTFVRNYAKEKGYKYLMELDDDVVEIVRNDTKDSSVALTKCITDFVNVMDLIPKVGGIRICKHKTFVDKFKDNPHKWIRLNNMFVSSCFVRTSCAPDVSRYRYHEDVATSISIWESGHITLMYGLAGIRFLQYTNEGGCVTDDRNEVSESAIEKIIEDFPHVTKRKGKGAIQHCLHIKWYENKHKSHDICIDNDNILKAYIGSIFR